MTDIITLITAELDLPDLAILARDPVTKLADLRIDGPARVHLGMQIEDAYGISLPDDVVQGWGTVADVMESVAARAGERVNG